MSAFQTPDCILCKKSFRNMESLDVHMKNVHLETDNDRITRLTATFSSIFKPEPMISIIEKSNIFDCSECGVIFKNFKDMEDHINNAHKVTEAVTKTKDSKEAFKFQFDEGETDSSSDEDEITTQNFVEHKWGDNLPEEPTGINFKAKTNIFKQAVAKVKTVFRKGSKNVRNGITATVTNVVNKSGGSVSTVHNRFKTFFLLRTLRLID